MMSIKNLEVLTAIVEGIPYSTIAKVHNCTRQRIGQIKKSAQCAGLLDTISKATRSGKQPDPGNVRVAQSRLEYLKKQILQKEEQLRRYSEQARIAIHFEQSGDATETAKKFGIRKNRVLAWARIYQTEIPKSRNSVRTSMAIVARLIQGEPNIEIARNSEFTIHQITKVKQAAQEAGVLHR